MKVGIGNSETDVPDISGIPMDSNDNIIAKYRTVSDLETVPPAEIEEISKAKENLKNSVEASKLGKKRNRRNHPPRKCR